jgi:hypothetical protein
MVDYSRAAIVIVFVAPQLSDASRTVRDEGLDVRDDLRFDPSNPVLADRDALRDLPAISSRWM